VGCPIDPVQLSRETLEHLQPDLPIPDVDRLWIDVGLAGMTLTNTPPHTAQSNIEKIVQLEEEDERRRSFSDRFPEMIGSFAGSVTFVVCQLTFVGLWAVANSEIIPGLPVFDPFPFSLLSGVLGLESVLLTAFVLIRQNRMSLLADRRSHLDLQISLLAEKETTKIIQMLERMSQQMGMERHVTDRETKELGQATAVEDLARELTDKLDGNGLHSPGA